MAIYDTIGDFLTTLRNASRAGKQNGAVSWSKLRLGCLKILKEEKLILDFKEGKDAKGHKILSFQLKYVDGISAITHVQRYSKPGRRCYYGYRNIPPILNGMGIGILTTPKGILKDAEARRQQVGGELLCMIW